MNHKITLDLPATRQIASLSVLTDPKNQVPQLTEVKIDLRPDGLTAYATDRYVAGRFTYETDFSFGSTTHLTTPLTTYLPPDTTKWLLSLKPPARGIMGWITIEFTPTHNTITYGNQTHTYTDPPSERPYPNIDELFTIFTPADTPTLIRYNPNLIAKLAKLLDRAGKKIEAWDFVQGKPTDTGRLSPTLATTPNHAYEVLIQPMLLK